MVLELKLHKVGNSVGVVLPKALLTRLNAGEGDTLTVTETPDGVRLTAKNPEFAITMAVFASLSRRYRNTLHELAN